VTTGLAEDELAAGSMRAARPDGAGVAIALEDGSFAAFDDRCTHEECPLSHGDLER
jgi:nitrite reductase/ring-hydroxylating ferredoxin subunit